MEVTTPTRDAAIRLLLLEDNPNDAKLSLLTLGRAGLNIESDVVRDSHTFMEAMRSRSYNAILCDYSLPGWNGLEALRWVRSSGFTIPFIYVSGTLGEEVAVDCIKQGATDYVVKGNLGRLPHAIRRALQEEKLRLDKERAENDLRRSEERYRLLFESNPHPMWVFQIATLRFLAVNDAALEHYDYSRTEFLSMTLRDIRPPEDIPALETSIWRTPDRPGTSRIWRHRTKYGRIVHVEVTGRNIEFEGRAASLVLAIDVTERIKAEDAVKRSEAEYRSIVHGAPYGIYRLDDKGDVLMANPALVTMLGCRTEGEVIRLNSSDEIFWDPEEVRRAVSPWEPVLQSYETRWRSKNGEKITVRLAGRELSGAGSPEYEVFVENITARKQAEDALRSSEERFSKAFRNSPLAITISTEAEGRYLDANDAFLKLLGYAREEVIGHTAAELRFWTEPSDRGQMIQRLKKGESVAKHNTRHQTKSGEIREAEVWAETVDLDGQRCVLAITQDVTEFRQLEAQFRQAQKMEAVGQLAGGVAHDFNNLLMIIASYARLIPEHVKDPENIQRYAMQIDEAVSRAASVTRQLLAFSRKQVLEPTVLSLNTLILGLGKMIPRLLGSDIEMSLLPNANGMVRADATQMEQVLLNLALNARDAMPSGGKLIIETNDIHLDAGYPGHKGTEIPAGDYVMLAVSDTGVGMSKETQTHIFEPFFTTKGSSGTGLGLATVYGIVKQSEGFIWVYSEPGQGTTFKVYLHKIDEPEQTTVRHRAAAPDPRGSETVLLVEDEAPLRTVIQIYLQSLGYTVLTAGNGEEALIILQNNSQVIELLITDIVMPLIGGPELAEVARKTRPSLPVIYISGYTDRALDRSTIGENGSFLQKPFGLRTLAQKIREVLEKG